ncbi:MAG TPA: hypothetical protein VIG40_03185 [Tissierellaceae bacterium]
MIDFREKHPVRICKEKYKTYRRYKKDLAKDFNYRCGYTDCPDFWFGGSRNFHIDHFMPSSKYPDLETEYGNLVYACSYVNILKSDDDGNKYLDPCDDNLNEHFFRDISGKIFPRDSSQKAQYMYERLKLYLSRYSIIWNLERIRERMCKLHEVRGKLTDQDDLNDVNSLISDLNEAFLGYIDYLSVEQ